MATVAMPKDDSLKPQQVEAPGKFDWTKPGAMAIPKEGYFKEQRGR